MLAGKSSSESACWPGVGCIYQFAVVNIITVSKMLLFLQGGIDERKTSV